MIEFAERNGCKWFPPEADGTEGDETVAIMVALAAGDLGLEDFIKWVRERIRST